MVKSVVFHHLVVVQKILNRCSSGIVVENDRKTSFINAGDAIASAEITEKLLADILEVLQCNQS